ASRFSRAVSLLDRFAKGGAPPDAGRTEDRRTAVRDALGAVEAVYATETRAVREWPERRRRVLAQLARLREILGAAGIGEEARREARALVRLIDPAAPGGGEEGGSP
ncbi:MAG TPA: hypothetical protein VIV57_16415, partial [Anaeromyxobacter sp.]